MVPPTNTKKTTAPTESTHNIVSRSLALLLLLSATTSISGQSNSVCEGELGQPNWTCETLAPVPADAYDGAELFQPLPGNGVDSANPVKYQQIAGREALDFASGERNDNAAVFVLTEGTYFCMVVESDGEAALFDAPEGGFVSNFGERYPSGSWLPESVKSLLGEKTELKYIVYTHGHWDHMGAAGIVVEYFKDDLPTAIASRRIRDMLKSREDKDPTTAFGNTRGTPVPDVWSEDVLKVGGLRLSLNKVHAHQRGDFLVHLDKNVAENAAQGIDTTVVMVTDTILPGWAPVYLANFAQDVGDFYEALDTINSYNFDVLVPGHFTRLGVKEDVQTKVDFFADVLAGAEVALAEVDFSLVAVGTAITDPINNNAGNALLQFNEWVSRMVDVCETYVSDCSARGRDWFAELPGLELFLRSQCFVVNTYVRVG